MRIIAKYLPQFHIVPENSKWWGKNFTEWVAVKNAQAFYEGHNQPVVPFNNNYYNLLDKHTMIMQSYLMKEYGIDGFCFYHYYFGDGRLILEKPAENLMKWHDINMPFCFCWDCTTWAKSWSKLENTLEWMPSKRKRRKEDAILIKQDFGSIESWKKHFDYLLSFFLDERYIKYNGAPVFMFHNPDRIVGLEYMLDYWRILARKNGFQDLYIIGANTNKIEKKFDAISFSSPSYFWGKSTINSAGINTFGYRDIWNNILDAPGFEEITVGMEAFVNYDDTPRRGKNGNVVEGFNINEFEDCLYKLLVKNTRLNNKFTFINAWNEWAEGMHLEPDSQLKYTVLDACKRAIIKFKNSVIKEDEYSKISIVDTYIKDRYAILDKWISLYQKEKSIKVYLEKCGYRHISIYGFGVLGARLLEELQESNIVVDYIMDKNVNKQCGRCKVVHNVEDITDTELLIMTMAKGYYETKCQIEQSIDCAIVHLDDILDAALRDELIDLRKIKKGKLK